MSETAWMDNLEVRCRCGQVGVITGVEGSSDFPDNVWVTHRVGLVMQTHIHRRPQMPALMAQLARRRAEQQHDETVTGTGPAAQS